MLKIEFPGVSEMLQRHIDNRLLTLAKNEEKRMLLLINIPKAITCL